MQFAEHYFVTGCILFQVAGALLPTREKGNQNQGMLQKLIFK